MKSVLLVVINSSDSTKVLKKAKGKNSGNLYLLNYSNITLSINSNNL